MAKQTESAAEAEPDTPVEETPEQRLDRLRAELQTAEQDVAESTGDMRAVKSRDVPMLVVKAAPNAHVMHKGVSYIGADYMNIHEVEDNADAEFVIDGPTALALVMDGKVEIVRSATAEEVAADAEEAA